TMELHERLADSNGQSPTRASVRDPFAEIKNRIHLRLISELGPELADVADRAEGRSRVGAQIVAELQQEPGLSRADRDEIARDIADDVFGYGPLERLLSDRTI